MYIKKKKMEGTHNNLLTWSIPWVMELNEMVIFLFVLFCPLSHKSCLFQKNNFNGLNLWGGWEGRGGEGGGRKRNRVV